MYRMCRRCTEGVQKVYRRCPFLFRARAPHKAYAGGGEKTRSFSPRDLHIRRLQVCPRPRERAGLFTPRQCGVWAGQGSVGFTPGAGRGSGRAFVRQCAGAGQYGRAEGRAGGRAVCTYRPYIYPFSCVRVERELFCISPAPYTPRRAQASRKRRESSGRDGNGITWICNGGIK